MEKEQNKKRKNKRKMNEEQVNRIDKTKGIYADVKVSDELCEFLGIPRNSERSRQQITKMMFEYIKKKEFNRSNRH